LAEGSLLPVHALGTRHVLLHFETRERQKQLGSKVRASVTSPESVASLGLMSPGAATDGVSYFSLKTDDFFSHCPLQSDDLFICRLLTTPIFPRRLSGVLSKLSHKKK